MAVVLERLVVRRIDVDGAVAGRAASGTVGRTLVVEHQVPQQNPFAVTAQRPQENRLEVVDHAALEIVVPRADRSLRKVDRLVGRGGADVVQLAHAAPVVVPGRTVDPLRRIGVGIDVERIVLLAGDVVVVVVVVVAEDLGLDARGPERRAEFLDEGCLVLPRHVERHRIAVVERLVLDRDGVDWESVLLHFADPLHEILGVVVVVGGIQSAAGPRVIGFRRVGDRALHPPGARPGRTHDPDLGIDRQNLLQNGEDTLLLDVGNGEELDALPVAAGVFVHREVRTADMHADEAESCSGLGVEALFEDCRTVGLRHLQQVVARGAGDGRAETVDGLVGRRGVDRNPVGRHRDLRVVEPLLREEAVAVGRGDIGENIARDGIGFGTRTGSRRIAVAPAGTAYGPGKQQRAGQQAQVVIDREFHGRIAILS